MRILVTGASGQLGSELVECGPHSGHEVIGLRHSECDIRSAQSIEAALDRTSPAAVINCAAWTRVDDAESHREQAFSVNHEGAANLARACASRKALLCHLSTDYVFGDSSGMTLDESADTFPLGVYGASKLAGENAIRSILPHRHLIVRTAWLYGRKGPNFVLTMLRLAREKGELRVVDDQTGSPTWTGHLAPAVLRLVEHDALGTFHLTSSGSTTWHGFAQAIVEEAGLAHVPVIPITSAALSLPAPRPAFSVLDNRRWRELGLQPLPHWREGLRAYLKTLTPAAANTSAGEPGSHR